MDICEALYKHLSTYKQITDKVGGRIYPILLPQNCVNPAIVYSLVSANYDSALQGDTGYVRQVVQIVCHDKTYKGARDLSRLVKMRIQDLHGSMGGLMIDAVYIKSDYEINGNTALKYDTEEYMSSIEFEFHFNEKQ
jgi:hypothetical protein